MKNVRQYPAEKAVQTSGTAALIRAAAPAVVPLFARCRYRGSNGIVLERCMFGEEAA